MSSIINPHHSNQSHRHLSLPILNQIENHPQSKPIIINGSNLSLSDLIQIINLNSTHHHSNVILSDQTQIQNGIKHSFEFMNARTNKSVYGVTTGFGAAANTRTSDVEALQVSILEHLLAGVHGFENQDLTQFNSISSDLNQPLNLNTMPESIVRGAILIRLNSLTRGHSAVRLEVLDGLINLLNLKITPIVPLRASISASGDLSPLSYIAAVLCGHPDVYAIDRSKSPPVIASSAEILSAHQITPIKLGAKEGLALVNGTSFSASAASIALYSSHFFAMLSQVLTAMMTEAMLGQIGSFHPFIHVTARPHPGQIEVSDTIDKLLKSSQLVDHTDHEEKDVSAEISKQTLRQDRYPLRTAPQWIGPQLEDLIVAHTTISRELNSTTDNPLIDVENGIIHHGGNFQATSVATSMEKTRLALASIGKIMFAQMTELNNPSMNKGLPSCLNGAEPSTNYHTKGLDTATASYCSELQYLASPVTTHVQSAESHNQSVNSLALISARKTIEAVQVLKLLMASHLYCLCQAIDLRVLDINFKSNLKPEMEGLVKSHFGTHLPSESLENLTLKILTSFHERYSQTSSLDSIVRIPDGLEFITHSIIRIFDDHQVSIPIGSISKFQTEANLMIYEVLNRSREEMYDEHHRKGGEYASRYLGKTKGMYEFVRKELKIETRRGDVANGAHGPTVGSSVGKIVKSMDIQGGLGSVLIKMLESI
ncbi:phenylalanine ammonia-lyase [Melampsora americana]|nr:phenylalanine ammonia-lyase [Melampsora americana]